MVLKTIIRGISGVFVRLNSWAQEEEKKVLVFEENVKSQLSEIASRGVLIVDEKEKKDVSKAYSLWDFIEIKDNTQANHVEGVLDYTEWIDMDELRRRIHEVYRIKYKNERSLYPYVKTMTDLNLVETIDAGGKRKWRKKVLPLTLKDNEIKRTQREKIKALGVS
ncbi:MAG: hypothetical protein ABH821_02180 [archaeon]